MADFTEAIRCDPRFVAAYHYRSSLYCLRGQLREAIADISLALAVAPDNPTLYANRASAYVQIGDYEHAVGDADTAIRLEPGNAKAFFTRSSAFGGMKQYLRQSPTRRAPSGSTAGLRARTSSAGRHTLRLPTWRGRPKTFPADRN